MKKEREVKKEWIKRHKADPFLDFDIVYKDDEEIHEQTRMQFAFQSNLSQDAKKKGERDWRVAHASITDAELEFRFDQLLALSLVDVPDDFYLDKLYFKNPDDLKEIFQHTEDDNLKMIHN